MMERSVEYPYLHAVSGISPCNSAAAAAAAAVAKAAVLSSLQLQWLACLAARHLKLYRNCLWSKRLSSGE
jgi:hypothetical protein